MTTTPPRTRRVALAIVYASLAVISGIPPIIAVLGSPVITPLNKILLLALTISLGGAVIRSATHQSFSLVWCTFWVWSYIFLALAPMYQLSARAFPWLGEFSDETVTVALSIIAVGCATAGTAQWCAYSAKSAHARADIGRESSPRGQRALKNALSFMLVAYVACAAMFIAITGSALFNGKSEFQKQLIANTDIVGAGTLFFVSTAGAIVLPGVALVARRNGIRVGWPLIALTVLLGFIVTNPLAGSRFLTGGFLLALVGAAVAGKAIQRLIPAALGVALVTVFPSLDLMRGDGTGATHVSIAAPADSLLSFDFDSFEMLLRAASVSERLTHADTLPVLIAPLLRWVPGLSQLVTGDSTGPLVASLSGMGFTNVSMPLWAEAYIAGGTIGVVIGFALLGVLFGLVRPLVARSAVRPAPSRLLVDAPLAALMVMTLRGSLYEVFGYVVFAITVGAALWLCAQVGRPRHPQVADEPRPRTVAFYLPQFHAIPENDLWWGNGFTEWVNVRRARPMFDGHDHPRRSTEVGEYDLTDVRVMHQQAELARQNGVDAFCFYFYWFGGARLLQRPVEQYLANGPDFPFCISWANESWSRRWDGKEHESLITQEYTPTTAEEVFQDFLPYLRDPRYLRVDGAAVLLVHRADHLPDSAGFAGVWHRLADEAGVGPLQLVASETHPGITPESTGFDAVAEFPPVGANTLSVAKLIPVKGLHSGFRGRLMSYPRLARRYRRRASPEFTRYRGVVPGWDNTARRGAAATVYVDAHPAVYRDWLVHARTFEQRIRGNGGLVFINAWNEWAEGAHLEPDATSGRAFLEATRWDGDAAASRGSRAPAGLPSYGWFRSIGLAAGGSALQAQRRIRRSLAAWRGRRKSADKRA